MKSSVEDRRSQAEQGAVTLRSEAEPLAFLTLIFLLNFLSRIILAPLLPTIEKELAISHGQAGFFSF